MAKPLPQPFDKQKVVAENRRARFDYFVEDRFEAGIQLAGTEVKSLRHGEGSIAESYATVDGDEVWLINSHIPEYSHGNRLNHEPRRPRKLLLKNREIAKLQGAVTRQGLTLVPLSIYFNGSGRAKVELALARGKKVHDKRETVKERDWKREQQRLLQAQWLRRARLPADSIGSRAISRRARPFTAPAAAAVRAASDASARCGG